MSQAIMDLVEKSSLREKPPEFEIGDRVDDMGDNIPFVDLGTFNVTQICAGDRHTCALSEIGTIKCWGRNDEGQLGYEDKTNRGRAANDMGDNLKTVDLGTNFKAIKVVCGYWLEKITH